MWAKPRVYFCHSFPRFVTHFLDTPYTRDNAHRVFNSGKKRGLLTLDFTVYSEQALAAGRAGVFPLARLHHTGCVELMSAGAHAVVGFAKGIQADRAGGLLDGFFHDFQLGLLHRARRMRRAAECVRVVPEEGCPEFGVLPCRVVERVDWLYWTGSRSGSIGAVPPALLGCLVLCFFCLVILLDGQRRAVLILLDFPRRQASGSTSIDPVPHVALLRHRAGGQSQTAKPIMFRLTSRSVHARGYPGFFPCVIFGGVHTALGANMSRATAPSTSAKVSRAGGRLLAGHGNRLGGHGARSVLECSRIQICSVVLRTVRTPQKGSIFCHSFPRFATHFLGSFFFRTFRSFFSVLRVCSNNPVAGARTVLPLFQKNPT